MNKVLFFLLFTFLLFSLLVCACNSTSDIMEPLEEEPMDPPYEDTLRFASFNVSMFGNAEGQLAGQLENANQYIKFKRIAAIIQKVRPDVLVLMEFDYDSTGRSIDFFNNDLLSVSQDGDEAINYEHRYQIISNTGVLSGQDFDSNNNVSLPNDAFGFGQFEGQYASAILSKLPLEIDKIRSFRNFLWKDMPNPKLPEKTDGTAYYSEEALSVFRLSSKNHVDIPIKLPNDQLIHALISHPTPPVFDGPEDRNGKRNYDEIRLFADYISNESYLKDDQGMNGGLNPSESFIIFGDLNADPLDGDSFDGAMNQLLDNPLINQDVASGSLIPQSNGGADHNQSAGHVGDPKYDTSFFGLRIDYVLPSKDLDAIASGVFWPAPEEPGYDIVKDGNASDHLLVWIDVKF